MTRELKRALSVKMVLGGDGDGGDWRVASGDATVCEKVAWAI